MNWLRQTALGSWYIASVAMCAVIVWFCCRLVVIGNEASILQRQAIERGHAEWKVSPDGHAEWRWKDKP